MYQLCADTECSQEDQLWAMDDGNRRREQETKSSVLSSQHDNEVTIYIYIYIYITVDAIEKNLQVFDATTAEQVCRCLMNILTTYKLRTSRVHNSIFFPLYIYIYMFVCVCVCVFNLLLKRSKFVKYSIHLQNKIKQSKISLLWVSRSRSYDKLVRMRLNYWNH